jgi:hypothetical protein
MAYTPMMADHQNSEEHETSPGHITFTPPTPQSQFSSFHPSPHTPYNYPVHLDGSNARYSYLYPVNPEQDRAVTYDEEQYMHRENRSTIGSTGLESISTLYDHDTGKEIVQQLYPYKEIVSPPLPSAQYGSPDANGMYYYGAPSPYLPDEKIDPPYVTAPPTSKPKLFFGFLSLRNLCGIGMLLSAIIIGVAIFLGIHFGVKHS